MTAPLSAVVARTLALAAACDAAYARDGTRPRRGRRRPPAFDALAAHLDALDDEAVARLYCVAWLPGFLASPPVRALGPASARTVRDALRSACAIVRREPRRTRDTLLAEPAALAGLAAGRLIVDLAGVGLDDDACWAAPAPRRHLWLVRD